MRSCLTIALLTFSLGLAAPSAQAGFVYQFADTSGVATTNFTVAGPGGTVTVRAYLLETDGSVLLNEELFSASVALAFDLPAGVATVSGVGDIAPNAAFANLLPAPSVSATEAGFTGDVGFGPFLAPAANRIFLGEFTLTGLSAGTTTLTLRDRNPFTDDTVTGFGTILDGDIGTATATLTVQGPANAVPAPGGLGLALLGTGLCALARGWRRLRPLV
jgi:hypothetical protein